eukprot:TCALIF_09842-PA protein Name:"Protein of unknown function" AED:0.06 eAED:0.06 QI:153/0.8/1/1/0.2/0.33/6/86/131
MCWRQEMNTCAICWIPTILGSDEQTIPGAQADIDTDPADTFIIGSIAVGTRFSDRVCGRFFSSANSNVNRKGSISICTQQRPFRMTFKTDPDEVTQMTQTAAQNAAKSNELNRVPGGIVGFNLRWTLQSCT